jgi:DNA-binding MarR family transcriptional regulator
MDETVAPTVIPSLERATHAVALWLERTLGDLHLNQAEAHVLGYLAHVQPCTINELHLSLGHKRSTLTSILDRLEQRGLVRRGPHPASRRLLVVDLTADGRLVAERVGAALRALEASVVERTGHANVAAFLRVTRAFEEEKDER